MLATANLEQYSSLVQLLIKTSAKASLKANNKFIEYLIVKLYQAAQGNKQVILTSLSLYCDLSLTLLDNRYFDRLKELVELEMALHGADQNYLL